MQILLNLQERCLPQPYPLLDLSPIKWHQLCTSEVMSTTPSTGTDPQASTTRYTTHQTTPPSTPDTQTFPTALVGALVGVVIILLLLLVLVGVVFAAVLWRMKGQAVRGEVMEDGDNREYDDVVIEGSEMIETRRNEAYGHLKRGEGGGEGVRIETRRNEAYGHLKRGEGGGEGVRGITETETAEVEYEEILHNNKS